jgi:DNA repair protein RecO
MRLKVSGIVLSSSVIFERDKRIELLTQSHGRVTLLGKGGAASKKRFAGRVEPTTVIEASVMRSGGMWPVTDCTVIEAFPKIREEFNRISIAMYLINLVRKITVDHQPHPELYLLLLDGLQRLGKSGDALDVVKQSFEDRLVALEGIASPEYQSFHFSHCFAEYTGCTVTPPVMI